MRTRLPNVDQWTPEFQRQLNGELERALERLNEYALVPYGGLEGQVLTKTSDRPFVMEWSASCCDSVGTPQPGTDVVGTKKLTCGTSVSFTPASDVPTAAAGDLAVLLIQPRHGLLSDLDSALVKPPSGWRVFATSPHPYGAVERAGSMPAIFYKFLEAGDISSTHTCTETSTSVDYLCGAALVYRNVNPNRPFGAITTYYDPFSGTNWGLPLPIFSTAQHVIDIWNRSWSSTEAGDLFPYDSSVSDWPMYDEASLTDYAEIKFGVTGTGGDSWTRQNSVATWKASIADDENLIPNENAAQSITAGTWAPTAATITPRVSGDWYTVLEPSASNVEHYVEFQQDFVAGDKFTYAPFVFGVSANSHGYWVSVIDPLNNERAALWIHSSGSSGWSTGIRVDDAADHGTVWKSLRMCPDADGVPETPVAAHCIIMTAPVTGTYKFRIYNHCSLTDTLAARTAVGSSSHNIGIRHVLLRHGWVAPYIVPTGTAAVIGSGASFSTPTRGWAVSANDRHLAISLNPLWENYETPYARMRSSSDMLGDAEYDPIVDGDTIYRRTGSGTDTFTIGTADQMIFPYVDGALAKYYFEVEIINRLTGNGVEFFGLNSPYVIPQNSQTTNNEPQYACYHYPLYGGVNNYTFWTDAVELIGPDVLTWANNDVWGVEVDFTALTIKFYQNGVLRRTTTISNQFPTDGGANYYAANGALTPLRLIVGCSEDAGSRYRVRLRPDWLYGPSDSSFLPYDYTGSANQSAWMNEIPSSGSGAQIIYQDPGTGATLARSITGGDGIEVIQYDETVDVALKVSELPTNTVVPGSDFVPFYDASTGTHSKALANSFGSASPTTTAGDLIKRGASADERLAIGTEAQVLTVVSGAPAWAAATGGGSDGATFRTNDGCTLQRAASQALTAATWADISWDVEVRDDNGYFNSGTPTRVTIPESGWYVLSAYCRWSSASSFSRCIQFVKNGLMSAATGTRLAFQFVTSSTGNSLSMTDVQYLAAGDYITVGAYSTGTETISDAIPEPQFSIHRLGNVTLVDDRPVTPVDDGASVTRATSQSIPSATNTAISWSTEARDDGAYWAVGAPTRFTITNAGWYLLNGYVRWDATTAGGRGAWWQKNGSTVISGNDSPANVANMSNTAVVCAYLSAGDYVELVVRQSSGGAQNVDVTYSAPNAQIHRLGTASSPGNPVNDGAEVSHPTTTQSIATATFTAVAFSTEVRDDGGYATLGTNNTRLTAANAGWYALTGTVSFASNGTSSRFAFFSVNGYSGVDDRRGLVRAQPISGVYTSLNASAIMYLAAGDYVELICWQGTGSALALDSSGGGPAMAIHRLGTPAAQEFDPATAHNFYDDFVATDFSSNDAWSIGTASGGGVAQASESKHPGTIVFSTSANNAGYAIATLSPVGDSAFTVEQLYFMPTGTDELHFEACIKCGTLSTVGSPAVYRIGFSTDASAYSHYAFLDFGTANTLRAKGGGGSGDVALSSSVTANTWHKLRITLTATAIRAFIDGVLVATQSTAATFPTGGFTPMLFAQNLGGTGVNHALTVDYVRVWGTVTRN